MCHRSANITSVFLWTDHRFSFPIGLTTSATHEGDKWLWQYHYCCIGRWSYPCAVVAFDCQNNDTMAAPMFATPRNSISWWYLTSFGRLFTRGFLLQSTLPFPRKLKVLVQQHVKRWLFLFLRSLQQMFCKKPILSGCSIAIQNWGRLFHIWPCHI